MSNESISLIIPTRKRVNGLIELLDSLVITTKYPKLLEICFVVDDDDSSTINFLENQSYNLNIKYIIIPRGKYILGQWWDIGYNKLSTGSILMLCADDFRFRSIYWDQLVYNEFLKYDDKIIMVYGDDLFVSKNLQIATFSFVHRKWIENSPFWLPPYFTTDYVDTWLSDIADDLKRKIFLPNLVIEHMHFLANKITPDVEANKDAYARIMYEKKTEENKKIYYSDEKKLERMKHFNKLKNYINNFTE
jgi:hypothetical protein